MYRNEHATGRALYEESLALRRELRDRWAIGNSLNNLGVLDVAIEPEAVRAPVCTGDAHTRPVDLVYG